jgi:hypothetical protein
MNVVAPIAVAAAQLPIAYANAKTALANCASIDECQDWADKAAALASYAKQADDKTLENYALRIRARAIRRAGELLKEFDGKGNNQHEDRASARPTQRKAAADVGMSEHQQKQAVRVAKVPAENFESQIESDDPSTVTSLANQGKRSIIDLKGRDPDEFNRAMHFVGAFESYRRDIDKIDADAALPILIDSERDRIRKAVSAIDAFHDRIITRI